MRRNASLWFTTGNALSKTSPWATSRSFSGTLVNLGRPPPALVELKALSTEDDHRLAREWLEGFTLDDIPKGSYEVTYSRSSGAGGQHVNTTSSKASVRLPIYPAIGSWLPRYLLPGLQASPHYTTSPPSILVTSQLSRSAPQNLAHALSILHKTLVQAAQSPIQGETSSSQRDRVKHLVQKDKARTRAMKDKLKSKKDWRRGD